MRAETRVGVLVLSEACGNRADTFLSPGLVLATLSLNDLCVSHYAAHTEEVSSSNPVSTMLITVTTSSECMPARSARIPDLNNPPNMSQTFRGQGHVFFYLWTFILDLSYLWRPSVLTKAIIPFLLKQWWDSTRAKRVRNDPAWLSKQVRRFLRSLNGNTWSAAYHPSRATPVTVTPAMPASACPSTVSQSRIFPGSVLPWFTAALSWPLECNEWRIYFLTLFHLL